LDEGGLRPDPTGWRLLADDLEVITPDGLSLPPQTAAPLVQVGLHQQRMALPLIALDLLVAPGDAPAAVAVIGAWRAC
jgi:hypothetical protein